MSDTQQANNPQLNEVANSQPRLQNFRSSDPRRKSPFFAGFLSLMPGLGQIYVGYYQRGFLHVLVAGSVLSLLIAGGNTGNVAFFPLGIVFLIFFELYNVIDASRRAVMYNLSLDGVEQAVLPDDLTEMSLGGSFVGGGVLLVFGLIALSNSLFGLSLEWLEKWWPFAPIGLGAYLVYRAYLDRKPENEEVEESD
jgi:hypothetical protein